jgi:hypothetical protein
MEIDYKHTKYEYGTDQVPCNPIHQTEWKVTISVSVTDGDGKTDSLSVSESVHPESMQGNLANVLDKIHAAVPSLHKMRWAYLLSCEGDIREMIGSRERWWRGYKHMVDYPQLTAEASLYRGVLVESILEMLGLMQDRYSKVDAILAPGRQREPRQSVRNFCDKIVALVDEHKKATEKKQ